MNNLLEVKLPFQSFKNNVGPTVANLRARNAVAIEDLQRLKQELQSIITYYSVRDRYINGYLIDVQYNDIISKSGRIVELLKPIGGTCNDLVVGARFSDAEKGQEKHIITYYVGEEQVRRAEEKLDETMYFLSVALGGRATADNFNIKKGKPDALRYPSGQKTLLRHMIVDCSVIEHLSVPSINADVEKENVLLTFYRTENKLTDLLDHLKIAPEEYTLYGSDTITVRWDVFQELQQDVPYMISMISPDLARVNPENGKNRNGKKEHTIPLPGNEPIIGVIDTFFDNTVYFSNWVESTDFVEDYEMPAGQVRRDHGTAVCSLIVDGPTLNPELDDGCGYFRVRHFGVCEEKISVPRLVRKIQKIIQQNRDIHVWNLSLGTEEEVSKNFISYDAAELDKIQADENVIFVVAGTNDNREIQNGVLRVGSPADSLNSLVVNSVKRDRAPASYSREGRVLSFFRKPDVSYYGGDYEEEERVNVYTDRGEEQVYGTSFAAPWIARKLAYLIDIMGFPREIAKALIIDSSAKWAYKTDETLQRDLVGYGVCPINIQDIISSEDNEIRFLIFGSSRAYKEANFGIPVPRDEMGKYPYVARAAMCYFPPCSRAQGVDYTSRELTISFGRINNKDHISNINDSGAIEKKEYCDERESRKEFRKWENTKFISKKYSKRNRPLDAYGDKLWGLQVVSKERLSTKMRKPLNFGIVVTLRELEGQNRIEDFINACILRGYLVNEIKVENRIRIYTESQEEVHLE